jgi:hypothetical protein
VADVLTLTRVIRGRPVPGGPPRAGITPGG